MIILRSVLIPMLLIVTMELKAGSMFISNGYLDSFRFYKDNFYEILDSESGYVDTNLWDYYEELSKLTDHPFSAVKNRDEIILTIRDRLSSGDERTFKYIVKKLGMYIYSLFPDKTYDKIQDYVSTLTSIDIRGIKPYAINKPSDCPTTSLLASKHKALRNSNQAHDNCFVHTGIKVLDYFHETHSSKDINYSTSILDATLAFHNINNNSLDNGGQAEKLISFLIQNGGCKDYLFDSLPIYAKKSFVEKLKKFQASFSGDKDNFNERIGAYVNAMASLFMGDYKSYSEYGMKNSNDLMHFVSLSGPEFFKNIQDGYVDSDCTNCESNTGLKISRQIENLLIQTRTIEKILFPIQNRNIEVSLHHQQLRTLLCSNPDSKISYLPISFNRYSNDSKTDFFNEGVDFINASLTKKIIPQPVGISICRQSFNDTNYRGLNYGGTKDSCGKHAVVVTGQKYNTKTKECEYEVINSWGDNYKKSVYHEKKDGAVYLPARVMSNNVYRMFNLKMGNN